MAILFKKLHENAALPTRAHPSDAGLDITCVSKEETEMYIEYGTGLACAIPTGHVGLLCPRSSITKMDLMMKNSLGILDENFRGEIKFRFAHIPNHRKHYEIGDRIGQLLIVPIQLEDALFVDELGNTDRGTGGFGSTNA